MTSTKRGIRRKEERKKKEIDRSVEGDAALLLVDAGGRLRNPDARQVGTKQIHRPAPKMVQRFPTLRTSQNKVCRSAKTCNSPKTMLAKKKEEGIAWREGFGGDSKE